MTELTYKDYIKYLDNKMRDFRQDDLNPEEKKYFALIMKNLNESVNLPSYILKESLLSSKEHDLETLAAIDEIKSNISASISFSDRIKASLEKMKSIFSLNLRTDELINISVILFFISAMSLLSYWGLASSGDVNSLPLFGTAGSGEGSDISISVSFIYMLRNVGIVTAALGVFLLVIGKRK